ncbi:efflux RND transporter periplasmic adaptor subunit [Dongia sp.]|uniref:efflux RND transporter periplasmic adaptor subunit n=1 Tax=Dongia sp. TaxID=1977262 RepID=UPI0037521755
MPPPPGWGRRIFWFLFVLVIAALLAGAAAYYEYVVKPAFMAQFFKAPPPSPVETAIAATEDMPRAFETIGTMMAAHQVTVAPELEGRVEKINFESGQQVKAGDVLVQLDASTQRADLATYQAQARLASANLARTKDLAAKQYSTKQSVDQLQSELDQARAGIAKSQAIIDRMVVKAPFAGTLGIRQVNLGQYLSPGTMIVTLTDLETLFVDFTLPEQDRAQLSIDQPVEFRVDAFPDRVFQGEIAAIDPQVDPSMRAVKVRAALGNTDHKLQPGMYARIRVILPEQPNVVMIPEPAVDYTVYGESVYRLTLLPDKKDPDGKPVYKAEQTFVTVGARFDGKVAVLKGVNNGDIVVVGGQLKLHNGAEVILSEQKSLQNPVEVPKE